MCAHRGVCVCYICVVDWVLKDNSLLYTCVNLCVFVYIYIIVHVCVHMCSYVCMAKTGIITLRLTLSHDTKPFTNNLVVMKLTLSHSQTT